MQRIAAVLLPTLVALAACGAADDEPVAAPVTTAAPTVPPPTTTLAPQESVADWPPEPPPVVFLSGPGAIEVDPFTVCWSEPPPDDPDEEYEAWCADGMPENPPTIEPSADGTVTFSFAVPGWSFSARWLSATGGIPVTPVGDTTWTFDVPDEVIDIVTVSGFGPQGDVHAAIRLPGASTPLDESTSPCVQAIDLIRSGLPAYDYEPAADLMALIDRVDAVVVGTIDSVGPTEDETIEFRLADVETWGGDVSVSRVRTDGVWPGEDLVGERLAGARIIALVHRMGDGSFDADVQGIHVECEQVNGVRNVIEPLPAVDGDDDEIVAPRRPGGSWSINLLTTVLQWRKVPVESPRTAHPMPTPAAITPGETVPVQVWNACGFGIMVAVGSDRYVLEGQPEPPPWFNSSDSVLERSDFPSSWEVLIIDPIEPDGPDWVVLDAVAERADDTTIDVRHAPTGDPIGAFQLVPAGEGSFCG